MLSAALMCLALNIYHEARGETLEGQIAVAYVTHTRAKKDPAKYCAVIYAKDQFSWTRGKPRAVDKRSPAWKDAVAVAKSFRLFADRTKGATHYHLSSISPRWGKEAFRVASIGRHKFYRLT